MKEKNHLLVYQLLVVRQSGESCGKVKMKRQKGTLIHLIHLT